MAQCVMTSGMSWRPEWSALNWDTSRMVHAYHCYHMHYQYHYQGLFNGSLFPELYNEFGVLNSVFDRLYFNC